MQLWKSPLGATVLFALIILTFQFTDLAGTMREIGVIALLAIVTFFIHEVGHVVFGVAAGYQFNFLTAGPITIERGKISANKSWAFFGGIASCSPKTDNVQIMSRQHFWFAAGGPIISLVVSVSLFILDFLFDLQWIKFFGLLNLGIFIVTAIPLKGGLKSDGRVMLELLRNGEDKEQLVSSMILIKEMMSPVHPMSWPPHLIEQTRTAQATESNTSNSYLLFYYDLLTQGFEAASKELTAYKALPVTKKNKLMLQFITHVKQLDLVMQGQATVAQLQHLHQLMMPVEPVSYKRSEWMIAKLARNDALAAKKLAEHRTLIEKGKPLYGFYFAEERITDLVEECLK